MSTCEDPQVSAAEESAMEILSSSFKKRADDYQLRAAISVAGEQLRLRLHNSKLIKEYRENTLTYPNCFMANEALDWLITHKEAPDRETAMNIMQKFVDYDVIHHVCDVYPVYKDDKLMYRFRNDDGTLPPSRPVKIFVRGQRLFETMVSDEEEPILKVREIGSEKFRRTFLGREILDWLVNHGEVSKRSDGVELCRAMLEFGIIQHVTGHQHFSDSDALFQFSINFRRKRKLIEVLSDLEPSATNQKESPDSPFCLRKLSAELPPGSFVCAGATEPDPPPPSVRRSLHSATGACSYRPPRLTQPLQGPPSVLSRPVSVEELLAPGAPYMRKTINIMGDDVGWGFVIRGVNPPHIQAVDPGGPAAAAGVKTRQFLNMVNGMSCLHMDYQTLTKLIVNGPRNLIMEVFEPLD